MTRPRLTWPRIALVAILITAWMTRYEVTPHESVAYVFDRWTGDVCWLRPDNGIVVCTNVPINQFKER